MAMFPSATNGYMPYVQSKQTTVKQKRAKQNTKSPKSENRHSGQKMYQVTLRDKKGKTYKYIVRTDGSHSLPNLNTGKKTTTLANASLSLPNLGGLGQPSCRKVLLAKSESEVNKESYSSLTTSLDLRECGKKEGLFSSLIRFLKRRTGGKRDKKCGKSKRKPRDLSQRKRQRTVSAMSNLDPIQESPNEQEYEDDEDVDSYAHDSSSLSSDSESETSSLHSKSMRAVVDKS